MCAQCERLDVAWAHFCSHRSGRGLPHRERRDEKRDPLAQVGRSTSPGRLPTMLTPSARSNVEPFHVMEVLAAAAELQRTHGDAIILCAGQPSTPAPKAARDAAVRAL